MNRKTAALLAQAKFSTEVFAIKGESLVFEDDSFDSAVCTMTLCSVDDPAAVVAEMLRVLKPGGRYCFLEHVISKDASIARRQRFIDPLQAWLGCGCHLTRDTETTIRDAGFAVEQIERLLCKDMPGLDPRMYPLILGRAVKPSVDAGSQTPLGR